jgi:hypothetical protein
MSKNKIIIISSLLIVVAMAFIYLLKNPSDSSLVAAERRTTEFSSAKEVLDLLNKMSKVKLDDSIFYDKAFISLRDTTVELVNQPIGRNNPFAPLGADGLRVGTSSPATR